MFVFPTGRILNCAVVATTHQPTLTIDRFHASPYHLIYLEMRLEFFWALFSFISLSPPNGLYSIYHQLVYLKPSIWKRETEKSSRYRIWQSKWHFDRLDAHSAFTDLSSSSKIDFNDTILWSSNRLSDTGTIFRRFTIRYHQESLVLIKFVAARSRILKKRSYL